jgi:hypothetical protein
MGAPGCARIALTALAVTAATSATAFGAPIGAAPAAARSAAEPSAGPPDKPARPPRAPAIAQGRYAFAAFAGRPAAIKLAWPPIAGAARFHARWTSAGAAVETDLPGSATGFERSEPTPGHHGLSIVTIDAQGTASEPTEIAIDVVAIAATPPGGDAARPSSGPSFALGSTFASPGLPCRLGGGPAADPAVATAIGATTLACGGEPGQPRVEVPLVIAPVLVVGPSPPIARETPTRIHVTVASVAPIGERLDVQAVGDLALDGVARSATGVDVRVTARAGATGTGLVIRAGAVELGRVDIGLVDRPPPAELPRVDWFALDLGGQLGGLVLPSNGATATAIGTPTSAADTLTSGPIFGGRLGLFPIAHAGIESELALALPGFRGHSGVTWIASARAQLAARVLDGGRYGLRLLGGGGILGVLARKETSKRSIAAEAHWGTAFTIEARTDLWVRLEVLDVITTAQDSGFAHGLEIQIGVVTRLGRRDRSW